MAKSADRFCSRARFIAQAIVCGIALSCGGTFFTASVVHAAQSTTAKKLPELLAAVEAHYAKTGSLSADFSQEEISAAFGEKKTSQGKLAWKAPNLLRWETQSPEASLLVSNGKTVWIYTPPFDETENGQVIVRKASEVKTRLLDALLAGRFSKAMQQGLTVDVLPQRAFALRPGKGAAGTLKQAVVTIADHEPEISKVVIEYRDGNQSTIQLSQMKMGLDLAKSLFEFKIPPRTDVVKE